MQLSEEKQDQICGQFLEMMRRLDAHFASQVCSPMQAHAYTAYRHAIPGSQPVNALLLRVSRRL